jgi:hypothetical protein
MKAPGASVFAERLHDRAPRYFTDFGGGKVSVELVGGRARRFSALYRFELRANDLRRYVFVKVPGGRGGERGDERPFLVPETDPAVKFRFQYDALAKINAHFKGLEDPRFGTVPVLDLFEDLGAVVTEEVPQPPLYQLFSKASRLQLSPAPVDLAGVFRNVGAWLRTFHALPDQDQVEVIHERRADFSELIRRVAHFLVTVLDDEPFFRSVAETSEACARDNLPELLPLGLRFGDFGLTNILVGPHERVAAFDTLACWRVPIYQDIAYFLTVIKTTRAQVLSQGLAYSPRRLSTYEQEFLHGYFGEEPIPMAAIRLHEVLRQLEKWAARVVAIHRRFSGRKVPVRRLALPLPNRFFRKGIRSLLEAANTR